MTAGTAADTEVCGGLRELVGAGMRALGVRDELAAVPGDIDDTTIQVYGHHALVGPLPNANGGRPACPRCLARRWQSVRQRDLRDALELGGDTQAAGPSPYAIDFVADGLRALLAASETHTAPYGDAYAAVYQVDLTTLRVRRLPLVPDADCPGCGRAVDDSDAAARIELSPASKAAPDDFRLRPVDDYGLEIEAFANPLFGALGGAPWLDFTSLTTSPSIGAFMLRTGVYLRETLYGGHADSYRHSTQVGILEGLERAAGLRPRGKRTVVHGSYAALAADALDPRTCGLYADEFYDANPYVHRFTPEREIAWVWGWSLRDERPVLVPQVLVYYHSGDVGDRFVQETSNGCASGGSLEEAIYHGLMEAVERDAFLLTWYGRQSLPEIDPQTSSRTETRIMVDRLAMYGYDARFFDARMTFDIPVVTGVAVRRDGGLGTLAFGGGASLDPEAAMSAALCEIATDSVMVAMRTGGDEARLRRMVDDFAGVQGLHDHPLLYGLPDMRHHADFLIGGTERPQPMAALYESHRPAPPLSLDLRDDLEQCVKAVTAQGFDVIVVDQTMPEQRDLGLHTVSVLVPGLVPIDFGWMRQRAPHSPRLNDVFPGTAPHRVPHPFP